MTVVGAKGLSASHVIMLGFDDKNMAYVDENAFYVALTRARQSVHLMCSLKCGGSAAVHEYVEYLPPEHLSLSKYLKKDQREVGFSQLYSLKSYISQQMAYVSRPKIS